MMESVTIQKFEFGQLEFHYCYVIGTIDPDVEVNTDVAKVIIGHTKEHYGKRQFVYISDREFGHKVHISAYKLVDPKKMVGIALVSSHKEELIVSASEEQAVYSGSFGVFNNLDSAVSWAQSFLEQEEEEGCD